MLYYMAARVPTFRTMCRNLTFRKTVQTLGNIEHSWLNLPFLLLLSATVTHPLWCIFQVFGHVFVYFCCSCIKWAQCSIWWGKKKTDQY